MWFLDNAWLIPVIPAVAFFLIIFFGKHLPMKGAEVGIASLAASLVLSIGATYQWIQRVEDAHGGEEGALASLGTLGRSLFARAEEGHESPPYVAPIYRTWTWWQSGGTEFKIGIAIDGLSVMLLLVVSVITTLILIYSLEYMRGDRRYTHFYASLVLFGAGMLCMVSAANTVQFLLGWEIMGLCSFLLIGHWWEELPNAKAALKAFFTVRTGDVGILIGFSILFFAANQWAQDNLGTTGFDIVSINAWANSGTGSSTVLLMASVALLIAVIGKSGQFPLHTWLPDAMAGPTPVSALLHSSTMVVAGVFLIARFYPVFWEGFSIINGGWNWVALVGGVTIVIAALLAFVQVDIKKVLAYSTVSQLGYMVMGLGVGAWTASVFHIFTHAWFKALLFLCAGSISHSGSHHSFDMKKSMGGLRKYMPVTFATWVIGTLALSGIFPLAGFWSKDEIVANAGYNGYQAFMIVGLAGGFMTAAYMTRATYLTFFGAYRGSHEPDHGGVEAEAHELEDDSPALHGVGAAVNTGLVAHAAAADHGHGSHAVLTADPGDHGDDGHGGGHGHDDHHGGDPHESPKLILAPLVVLAVLSIAAGFLNAIPFGIEKFKEWVEPSYKIVPVEEVFGGQSVDGAGPGELRLVLAAEEGGEGTAAEEEGGHGGETVYPPEGEARIFPEVDHAPFEWSKGLLALGIALGGIALSFLVCVQVYEKRFLRGLTRRNPVARAGYALLWNKYYLDHLYEGVFVRGLKGPIAKASYWINTYVIDAVVNFAGTTSRKVGEWTYKNVDQRVVDGVVNGAGFTAEGAGEALRPVQSGRVQQYGALLFAAAAIGALVLVIVV